MQVRVAVDLLPHRQNAFVKGPRLAQVAGQHSLRHGQTCAGNMAQGFVIQRGAGQFGLQLGHDVGAMGMRAQHSEVAVAHGIFDQAVLPRLKA